MNQKIWYYIVYSNFIMFYCVILCYYVKANFNVRVLPLYLQIYLFFLVSKERGIL